MKLMIGPWHNTREPCVILSVTIVETIQDNYQLLEEGVVLSQCVYV
jgi:hypothetical protein